MGTLLYYLNDQKKFTGHMFNIKLEERSYKMSFKALAVKIQGSKNRHGGAQCAPSSPGADRVKLANLIFWTKFAKKGYFQLTAALNSAYSN